MHQFQSLKRLLTFYALTLIVMLVLYYSMLFVTLKTDTEQHSQMVYNTLRYELMNHGTITNEDINIVLAKPVFENISYQMILMLPSGQTYVYRNTRPKELPFTTVTFPNINSRNTDLNGAYTLTDRHLTATINLENGQRLYIVMRHQPIIINLTSYRYWLPLMTAVILFIIALLYMLKRRDNWEQLLSYTDDLIINAKDTYTPPPFIDSNATLEFLRLGHALGRVSYQLHNKHRRIDILSHRLERLVEQAPLPMLLMTRQGQLSFFNPRFEQVFAVTFQRDTTYSLTDFVIGSDKTIQHYLQKITSQRVTRTVLVYGLVDKLAYQLHISPWFGKHGQAHGFTMMLNNVDDMVRQNIDVQLQNEHLNQQVVQLNELKSTLGHELRTPLNAIIGTLDLIEPQNLTAKQQEVVDTLTQSSHSMLAMLNDMLDLAKIEAGKIETVSEPVDIFKTSQHVSNLMVGNARRHELELIYFFMPDCPRYIHTDSKRLCQILLNLMDNAVKFTSSGYVALIVEPVSDTEMRHIIQQGLESVDPNQNTQPPILTKDTVLPLALPSSYHRLNNALINQQPWLHFSVQDTDIGIGAAEQSKIFSYFSQANAEISQQFGGTGLGLAISSSFAQLLGGFIQLTSEKGVGSTFHLYIPARNPTYQPVYYSHHHLKQIHLLAVVNQPVTATYLQRLCQHLSLRATISCHFDHDFYSTLNHALSQTAPTDVPLLMLDYEYYVDFIDTVSEPLSSPLQNNFEQTDNVATTSPQNNGHQQNLQDCIHAMTLPKILLSMKPERSIPSTLLDKFDGFLTKPLDVARLISELMRLAKPTIHTLNNNDSEPRHLSDGDDMADVEDSQNAQPLPLATLASNAPAQDTKAQVSPLILVVEDNLTNQKITCKLLSKLGFDSIVAEDGQQALAKLQQHREDIALILMDCRMPIMDGLQATQAIRAQGDSITIIALTANNSDEDRVACLAAGMDEFLTKPINKDKLKTVLKPFLMDV